MFEQWNLKNCYLFTPTMPIQSGEACHRQPNYGIGLCRGSAIAHWPPNYEQIH